LLSACNTAGGEAANSEAFSGLAEALRRSMSALAAKGGAYAHPSVWAPFMLVGNGSPS
jgi:CHAT domain-containing protein